MRTYHDETYRLLSDKARAGSRADWSALATYVRSLPDETKLFSDVTVRGTVETYTARFAKFCLRYD